jgi:rod shape determining protein RodA
MIRREVWLVGAVLALCVIGVIAIYSSTRSYAGWSFALRQITWIALGMGVMWIVARVRVKTLSALSPVIYGLAVLMLLVVLAVGSGPHGTRRWFDLGLFTFQPSEIAKLATILLLARYLSEKTAVGDSVRSIFTVFAMAGIPAILVLNEPDLGTAVVLAVMAYPLLYASGLDPLYLLLLLSPLIALVCAWEILAWVIFVVLMVILVVLGRFRTSLVAAVFGVNFLVYSLTPRLWASLAPYQQDRVLAFLKPENYRHGAGFQIIQSQIAIGSGGFFGKGLFQGTQKALGLVPAQHTDFIFSLIGEEFGFLGSLVALSLILFVVRRILLIGGKAGTRFSGYFCFGFASLILIQTFISVGMTLGITPVTGLPLPFISYGGSQMIVFWGGVGLVLGSYSSRRQY